MDNINFNLLNFKEKKAIIESVIFASDVALDFKTLYQIIIPESNTPQNSQKNDDETENQTDSKFDLKEIKNEFQEIINSINSDLTETNRPYQIVEFAGGWQFATRKEFGKFVHNFYKSKFSRRLSNAALEVLAIIAYQQPITKAEIEQIRGVNSNEVVNSLLDKSFIQIAGRKNVLGRPLMFEITNDFLRAFGLNNLEDLPKLKEFEDLVREEFTREDDQMFTLDISDAKIETIESEIEADDIESDNNQTEIDDNQTEIESNQTNINNNQTED